MAAYNSRIHILLVLSSVFCLASHAAAFNCSAWEWDDSDVISFDDAILALGTTMARIIFNDYVLCQILEETRDYRYRPPVNCRARFLSDFCSALVEYELGTGLFSESMSERYGRRAMTTRKKQPVGVRGKIASSWLMQAAVVGSALLVLICTVPALLLCIRGKRLRQSTSVIELRRGWGPRQFRYSELAAATDNFAEDRKIGRGGFGPVYRGYLSDQDRYVAIKELSQEQTAVQGRKEFEAEVTIMSRLRHRNIVQLVGWYRGRERLAIVYELVSGGSLDTHLYSPDRLLTWPERYKIALGLGSALRFLHTECDQCIVHGDIKPANVMLDASRNAKLGDFGLARLVDHGAEPRTTQVVKGTLGYIDPEFVSSHRPGAESDVYSFGVVLLEIACGRGPTLTRTDHQASAALLASVRGMHHRNRIVDAADRRLNGEFDRLQMERLLVTGLWCAHHDPMRRPSVAQAMDVLRSADAKLPVLSEMRGAGRLGLWRHRLMDLLW
ncbi:probable kinase CHARK [Aegilops tauschii subsp. strangulata]|uniref:probable kinase CHARK n=1 Tax=Aegilops tauschii subsp. strangulata TaxID=200361 RepID=UPI00098AF030|nr:probable kinase CHARK [Aegilops tauschii subsp. strangulata]